MRKQLGAAASGATDAATKGLIDALIGAGATDIGGALADGDIFPMYDLSATANRGSALSRIATWLFAKISSHATVNSSGVLTLANAILTNAMFGTAAGQPGSDWLTNTYTPTITNGTINLGTGVAASGEYVQIGKICIGRASITLGTTGFNKGSGTYTFGLPLAPMITGYSTALCIGALRISGMTSAHIANFSRPILALWRMSTGKAG